MENNSEVVLCVQKQLVVDQRFSSYASRNHIHFVDVQREINLVSVASVMS